MPRKCCVPGCHTNYDSGVVKSVFTFPIDETLRTKWVSSINRHNFNPSKQSVVCEEHFTEGDIVREDSVTKADGTVLIFKRVRPKLQKHAFPTVFPNQPFYSSKMLPKKRKTPEERQKEINIKKRQKRNEISTQDKIKDFDDLKRNYNNHIKSDYALSTFISDTHIVFYKLEKCLNEAPHVSLSVCIDKTLKIEIYSKTFNITNNVVGKDHFCIFWSQLELILHKIVFTVEQMQSEGSKNEIKNYYNFYHAPKTLIHWECYQLNKKGKKPATEEKNKNDGQPKRKRQKKNVKAGTSTSTCVTLKTESCLICCALECSNTSDSWLMTVFPQDPDLRQQWVDKIGRDDWTPDENSALCEIHFVAEMWEQDIGGERLLKPDAVPSLFFHKENLSCVNEESSLYKAGSSGQSMEYYESIDIEEHPLFIKQETLESDEMFGEEDKLPNESDKFVGEGLFETVYCNSEGTVSSKIKKEVEDREFGCLERIEENIVNPEFKCLLPECPRIFSSKETMDGHMKQCHNNTDAAEKVKNRSFETKPHKEMKDSLENKAIPLRPASGIFPAIRPLLPAGSSLTQTGSDSFINESSGLKKFVLLTPPQQSGSFKAQNQAPLPPPEPPTTSQWPPVDDSEIFSISLARFSKEKRIAIKKKIIEFVDTVDKRDIDPELVIMALCKKN